MCAQCGEREAVVFIRRTGDSATRDSALCESCARSRGVAVVKGSLELSLGDLLSVGSDETVPFTTSIACPSCGLEFAVFRRDGRLGCASCADAFKHELLRRIGPRRRGRPVEERRFKASAFRPNRVSSSQIEMRLDAALSAEDYEAAAILRDALSRQSESDSPQSRAATPDFLFKPECILDEDAPEADVVLWTNASVRRNVEGFPFPGASAPDAARLPIGAELFNESDGWKRWSMSELGSCGRRCLAERGFVPRAYAAIDDAVVIAKQDDAVYALLGETDHLRALALRPGFDPEGAMAAALGLVDYGGRNLSYAFRPEIGWICSRVSDCGRGTSLSALLHLPALSAAGLVDRLFKTLMAEGVAVRGSYSNSEGSGGSLYEIGVEADAPVEDPVAALDGAVRTAVAAERRALSGIASKKGRALEDSEGRAFGLIRHCRLLGADEAASALSTLRLAALRGALKGSSASTLASLLLSLGPGALGLAVRMRTLPAAEDQDELRAGIVKEALREAEYRPEEATPCSRD